MGISLSSGVIPERSSFCPQPYCTVLPTCENKFRENVATELAPDRSTYFLMSHVSSPTIEVNNKVGVLKAIKNSEGINLGRAQIFHKHRRASAIVQSLSSDSSEQSITSEPGCFGLRSFSAPTPSHNSSLSRVCVSSPTPPPYARARSMFSNMFSDLTRSGPSGKVSAHTSKVSSKRCKKKVWVKNGVSLITGNRRPANSSPPLDLRENDLYFKRKPELQSDQTSPAPPPLCYHPLLMDCKVNPCQNPDGRHTMRNRSRVKTQLGTKRKENDSMAGGALRRCSNEVLDLQDHMSKARGRPDVEPVTKNLRRSRNRFSESDSHFMERNHQNTSFDEFDSDLSSDSAGRSPDLSYFSLVPRARTPERTSGPSHLCATNDNAELLPVTPQSPSSNRSSLLSHSRSVRPSPAAPLTHELGSVGNQCSDTRDRFVIKDSCSSSDTVSTDLNTVVDVSEVMSSEGASTRRVFLKHALKESSPAASRSLGGRSEGLLPDENYDACSTRVTNDIVERCLQNAHAQASVDIFGTVGARLRNQAGSESAVAQNVYHGTKSLRSIRSPQKRNSLLSFMSSPRKSMCDALGRLKLKRDTSLASVLHTTRHGVKTGHVTRVKTSSVGGDIVNSRHAPRRAKPPQNYQDEAIGAVCTSEVSPPLYTIITGPGSRSNIRAYANFSPRVRVSRRTISACVDASREICVQRRCVLKSYHHLGLTRRIAERLMSLMNFEDATPSFPDVLSFEKHFDDTRKYAPSISEMLAADRDARAHERRNHIVESIPEDLNSLFYHPPSYRFEKKEYPSILEIERTFCRLITDLKLYESSLIGALILIERLVGLTSEKAETSIACVRRMSLACRGNECAHRRKSHEFHLHKNNWRTILYVAILTTQKIWDDVSWTTENFAKVVSWFTFAHSCQMEVAFLNLLHWDVSLSAAQYNSFMKGMTTRE